jgi:hypothetical protein
MEADPAREGGCLCGRVRYAVRGEPTRVGMCHCADCRKESGAPFTLFAVWPSGSFSATGETRVFKGRAFCIRCGSRLFNPGDEETEIRAGTLDAAPTGLLPSYEIWIKRRETWLQPLPGAGQYEEDRPKTG